MLNRGAQSYQSGTFFTAGIDRAGAKRPAGTS